MYCRKNLLEGACVSSGCLRVNGSPHGREILGDTRAVSLVEAADADLGQIVFRDLVLSFRLPRSIVRQRRTLILERGQTQQAESNHPEALNRAHTAAMQSPSDVWVRGPVVAQEADANEVVGDFLAPELEKEREEREEREAREAREAREGRNGRESATQPPTPSSDAQDSDAVERACALLSGLAMNMSPSADATRTGDAFAGRVELPFLATRAPAPTLGRIALNGGVWYYYRINPTARSTRSPLQVLIRGTGLAGLLACAVRMLDESSTN